MVIIAIHPIVKIVFKVRVCRLVLFRHRLLPWSTVTLAHLLEPAPISTAMPLTINCVSMVFVKMPQIVDLPISNIMTLVITSGGVQMDHGVLTRVI